MRARNVDACEPLVRHLEGKFWELRRESGGNIYRLMYFLFSARRIVFLHGGSKKNYISEGQRAYEEWRDSFLADPENRRLYDEEAAKSELWPNWSRLVRLPE